MADADGLLVEYFDDGDGTGELSVGVAFEGWAGASSASFAKDELLDFARQMLAFPMPPRRSFQLAGGYRAETGGALEEELVFLRVRPVGPRGQLGVVTRLATPSDDPLPRQVRVEVLTTYEALRRFSAELTALVRGEVAQARLDAEVMA